MIDQPPPKLNTSGIIATELGVPLHRVLHVLRTRHFIKPSAMAGTLRLYDRESLILIRQELRRIDSRRGGAA